MPQAADRQGEPGRALMIRSTFLARVAGGFEALEVILPVLVVMLAERVERFPGPDPGMVSVAAGLWLSLPQK